MRDTAGPIAHHRIGVVAAVSKYGNAAYKRRSAQMKGNAEAGRSAYGAASMKATEAFVPAPQRLFEDKIVMDFLPRPVQFLLRRSAIRAVFHFWKRALQAYEVRCFAGRDASTMLSGTPSTKDCRR